LYKKAVLKGKPKEVKYIVAKKSQGMLLFFTNYYSILKQPLYFPRNFGKELENREKSDRKLKAVWSRIFAILPRMLIKLIFLPVLFGS